MRPNIARWRRYKVPRAPWTAIRILHRRTPKLPGRGPRGPSGPATAPPPSQGPLELSRDRFEAGLSSQLEVSQAQAQLQTTLSRIPGTVTAGKRGRSCASTSSSAPSLEPSRRSLCPISPSCGPGPARGPPLPAPQPGDDAGRVERPTRLRDADTPPSRHPLYAGGLHRRGALATGVRDDGPPNDCGGETAVTRVIRDSNGVFIVPTSGLHGARRGTPRDLVVIAARRATAPRGATWHAWAQLSTQRGKLGI